MTHDVEGANCVVPWHLGETPKDALDRVPPHPDFMWKTERILPGPDVGTMWLVLVPGRLRHG